MANESERVQKLESHVTELERQVEQLNEVIIEQARDLDRLKKQFAKLAQTVENTEMERIKSTNQKPPHYQ